MRLRSTARASTQNAGKITATNRGIDSSGRRRPGVDERQRQARDRIDRVGGTQPPQSDDHGQQHHADDEQHRRASSCRGATRPRRPRPRSSRAVALRGTSCAGRRAVPTRRRAQRATRPGRAGGPRRPCERPRAVGASVRPTTPMLQHGLDAEREDQHTRRCGCAAASAPASAGQPHRSRRANQNAESDSEQERSTPCRAPGGRTPSGTCAEEQHGAPRVSRRPASSRVSACSITSAPSEAAFDTIRAAPSGPMPGSHCDEPDRERVQREERGAAVGGR